MYVVVTDNVTMVCVWSKYCTYLHTRDSTTQKQRFDEEKVTDEKNVVEDWWWSL